MLNQKARRTILNYMVLLDHPLLTPVLFLFPLVLFFFFLQNEVAMLLKPISEKIQEIQNFRERNRGSKMFNHLSAVSESIPALGWIAVVSDTHGMVGRSIKKLLDGAAQDSSKSCSALQCHLYSSSVYYTQVGNKPSMPGEVSD